jgi:DNA repair exonuclease SbcCD nuclease subunit
LRYAFISDIHFGIKNDNLIFLNYQKNYFQNVFIPLLTDKKIDQVFILGDVFDRRKYVSYNTLYEVKKFFFDNIKIPIKILIGNHDSYFKNTLKVNSPSLILQEYDNITIYDSPVIEDGLTIIPWITQDNYEHCMELINLNMTDIVVGHFEINGFKMHDGDIQCTTGIDSSIFTKYKRVFTGHFHQPSAKNQITYLGSPVQYTWGDFGSARGFYLYDTSIDQLEFVQNDSSLFIKTYYDDKVDIDSFNYSTLEGKLVRLIIVDKQDTIKFDQFVDRINQANPHQFNIIDNTFYQLNSDIDNDLLQSEDTLSIIDSYISNNDTGLKQDKLKYMIKKLYIESLENDLC